MPHYPDYLISTCDKRFDLTWRNWSSNITQALHDHYYTCNYCDQLELVARLNYDNTPEIQINNDLIKAFNIIKEDEDIKTYVIGYDAIYCDLKRIKKILPKKLTDTENRIWMVNCVTAYGLTALLDTELLDYPIPNLNFICATIL